MLCALYATVVIRAYVNAIGTIVARWVDADTNERLSAQRDRQTAQIRYIARQ